MRKTCLRILTLSALAAGSCFAAPAFAGSPYYDAPDAAPMSDAAPQPIARRQQGHFTCSYNERRTRLERKNCGGARF